MVRQAGSSVGQAAGRHGGRDANNNKWSLTTYLKCKTMSPGKGKAGVLKCPKNASLVFGWGRKGRKEGMNLGMNYH